MPRRARSPWALAGATLLFLLVLVLPLARGGVVPTAQTVGLLLATLALALSAGQATAVPVTGLLLAVVLALVTLQAVPLPVWLHAASPGARSLFEAVLSPLGLYPAWRPLSLDPPATGMELAEASTALAAFLAAWLVGGSHRRRELLLLALPLSGLLVSSAVVGWALLVAGSLVSPTAPFVNPNHLASFLGLTSLATLGLALREKRQRRLLLLAAFSLMVAIALLTLSRGGIAGLLAGLTLFAVLALRREPIEGRAQQGRAPTRLAVAGALAAAAGLAAWLALGPLLREAASLGAAGVTDKLAVWPLGLQMARDFPWLGVGRGAFATAFPAYKTDSLQVTWVHLENEWLQAIVELGWVGGPLLLATLASAWLGAARRRDLSLADAGLLAGVAAVALHDLVDFSLQIGGVAVPFMVALGLAMRGAKPVQVRGVAISAVAVVLCALGLAGLSLWRAHPTDLDGAEVARLEAPDETIQAARAAAGHHPADWLPHAAAGQRLAEEGRCREALPWLLRAMLLSPTAPEPHLYAGRCLAAAGQDAAARRELRLAMTYGSREALPDAIRLYDSLDDLLAVVPDSPEALMVLGNHLLRDRPADAATAYRKAWEEYRVGAALVPLATSLARSGQPEEGLRLARERAAAVPSDAAAWRLAGSILADLGRETEAAEVLDRGLAASPGSPSILTYLAERSLAARRFGDARRLAEQMAPRTPAESAAKHLLEARALAGQDRLAEAIDRTRAASAAQPGAAAPLAALASYAESAGRFEEALQALEDLKALPGQDAAALEARRTVLRQRQESQRLRRLEQQVGLPPGQ